MKEVITFYVDIIVVEMVAAVLLNFFILISYQIASSNCQYFYPPPSQNYDYYEDPYYQPYQEPLSQSYHYGLPRSPYSDDANRREENVGGGWNFQPQEVMSEAKKAATMTRGMADLIDTKGNDFLSLLGDYTSTGITLTHKKNGKFTVTN